MPDQRVRIVTEGPYTVFDPENPEAFVSAAGSQFARFEGRTAAVRTAGDGGSPGVEMTVYPGWAVVLSAGGRRFVTPEVLAEGLASGG